MKVMTPNRTIAKITANGQKTQDHECRFRMFCMAFPKEKAVAIAPAGVKRKAGIKASSSPGPLHPVW